MSYDVSYRAASMWRPALILVGFASLCLVGLVGCGGASPRVCRASSTCSDGEACVVGRCTLATAPGPVAPTTRRLIVPAESIAFVTSSGEGGAEHRLASIALGASIGDSARILVRFPRGLWSDGAVAKAYLVLDRAEATQAGPSEVLLRAERIVEPWSLKAQAGLSWASPPQSLSITGAEARVAPRGVAPIRIDVTAYAVELGKKNLTSWGLRIEGKGDGYGVPIATGFVAGSAPRLEVFLNP